MDRIGIGPVKGLRIAVTAFVLSIVLMLCVVGGTVVLVATRANDLEEFSARVNAGLIESCEVNGNPMRRAVQGLLREQIRNSESPLVHELFPQIPTALIEAQIHADERRIEEVAPVNCSQLYPSKP